MFLSEWQKKVVLVSMVSSILLYSLLPSCDLNAKKAWNGYFRPETGHFEIQNGHFQAKNSLFRPFWHLSHMKVIKNGIKWMIPYPYPLVQLFVVVQIKIFLESYMAILKFKNGHFQAQNGHFWAFFTSERQLGIK